MHTLDLQARIFVQYPIGSASETCVLVLPPTTNQLKNLVVSYQVPNVNQITRKGFYNFHELIHGSEEYFIGAFIDDSSLFEARSIPSKIIISIMVQSIPLLEGTLFHECKVPCRGVIFKVHTTNFF